MLFCHVDVEKIFINLVFFEGSSVSNFDVRSSLTNLSFYFLRWNFFSCWLLFFKIFQDLRWIQSYFLLTHFYRRFLLLFLFFIGIFYMNLVREDLFIFVKLIKLTEQYNISYMFDTIFNLISHLILGTNIVVFWNNLTFFFFLLYWSDKTLNFVYIFLKLESIEFLLLRVL
jgi:hypothetical protein